MSKNNSVSFIKIIFIFRIFFYFNTRLCDINNNKKRCKKIWKCEFFFLYLHKYLYMPMVLNIALLPYCLIALLPYCLIALLPYCLIALLPYCLIALLPYCPAKNILLRKLEIGGSFVVNRKDYRKTLRFISFMD
jgi:hypothetical protein